MPLLLSLFLLKITPAQALIDPDIDWALLETPHFEIIYDASQKQLARRYAYYSEVAYADLLPLFREAPEKTVVWLNTTTDISNGTATALPYPLIVAYPVLPVQDQSVGHYHHWGQELMTHEYTHILQFEPTHGLMRGLRWIFGSVVAPNGALPRWWLEGLAVAAETRYSHGGRLRSAQQQAVLRALAAADQLTREDLSRINEVSLPDALGGQRPYLLGSVLWNEIITTSGEESIYRLNQRYSRRIPFIHLNGPAQDETGRRYRQHLSSAYSQITSSTARQMALIKAQGEMKRESLHPTHTIQKHPRLSPDATKLLFIERHPERGTQIQLHTRDRAQTSFLKTPHTSLALPVTHRMEWWPDSEHVIYDQIASYRHFYNFSDLYLYNLKTQQTTRLTRGLRAREPAPSPDGQKVLFVKIDGAQLHLALLHMKDKTAASIKTLYSPPSGHRVSHPNFLDAHRAVFAERNTSGRESIKLIDLRTGQVRPVLPGFDSASRPVPSAAGLIFISEKTGVPNAYLANASLTSAHAITNTTTAVNNATWDPSTRQLIFTEVTSQGSKIQILPTPPGRSPATYRPPQIRLTVPDTRPPYKKPKIRFPTKTRPYSPLKYLWPRYWVPFVTISTDGLFLQASTGGTDPLGRHRYSVLGGYDTATKKLNTLVNYTNQSLSRPISLGASDIYDFFASGAVRQSTSARASVSGFLDSFGSGWQWSTGWEYRRTAFTSGGSELERQGPNLSLRFIQLTRRGRQLVPEKGGDLLLSTTHYIKSLGTIGYTSVQLNGSLYWSKWLPQRHVLSSKIRTIYAPDSNLNLGASTAAGNFETSLVSNRLLMRGYLTGTFIAQSALNASFAYIFPLHYSYSGRDTWPLFSKSWHARLIADVISLDGAFFDDANRVFRTAEFGKFFVGSGAEVHWDVTIAYHMPFRIFLGLYHGLDDRAAGGFQTFLGFSL